MSRRVFWVILVVLLALWLSSTGRRRFASAVAARSGEAGQRTSLAPHVRADRPLEGLAARGMTGADHPASEPATFVTIHAALRELRKLDTDDDATRRELVERLDAIVTPRNAAAIARDLSSSELQTDFGTKVLQTWLATDPGAAAAWLQNHGIRDEQAAAIGAALATEPDRIMLVDTSLAGAAARLPLLHAAALQLADRDPARALRVAERLPEGDARADALQSIAYAWAAQDPVAAARYVTAVEDPRLRETLLAVTAKALAITDPDAGAAWMATAVHRPELIDSTAAPIVDQWANRDPARAAEWIATFSGGTARVAAIESVLDRWSQSDPAAAKAWLDHLPDRDAIRAHLAAREAERQAPKD